MNKPQTIGIVDLGSNSFHMMVARIMDDHFSVVDSFKEPVRLRLGLGEDGILSEEAETRALDCLGRFAQRLSGVDRVRIVGTNTLRRARETRGFLKKIEELFGYSVDVIGGIEEARLIYLGVASFTPPSEDRNFVVDIGGGSTEFIIGKNLDHISRETRPMGCVSFTMDFFPDGVMTKKRFKEALLKVSQEIEPFQQHLGRGNWEKAIGASGTVKSIGSAVAAITGDNTITRDALRQIKDRLPWGKPFESAPLAGVREDRITVFPGGFAILYGIFDIFEIKEMTVSQHSMREGLLIDYLGRSSDKDIREATVQRLKTFYSVDERQAERVKNTALDLFRLIMGFMFERRNTARKMIGWAADLHEMGQAIAHSGYHKHGAYIILNGDLDGFSQVEQCLLSFLVLNHRKRLKTDPLPYETKQEMPLVLIMRLAFILNRERVDIELPDMAIDMRKKNISLHIDPAWLKSKPMTKFDLELEQSYWSRIGYNFQIKGMS